MGSTNVQTRYMCNDGTVLHTHLWHGADLYDLCRNEVCRQVRELYPDQHLPIIMVSAATEEDAVVRSLDCGADDYITKPFKRVELLARIKAKLSAVQEQVRPLT